jgi:putative Ig domain-containing protein
MRIRLLTLIFVLASWHAHGQTLQITPLPSQGMIVGQSYTLPLVATGGSLPYAWKLQRGELPPGMKLHPHTAKISGSPTTPGDYCFTVEVSDTSIPKLHGKLDMVVHVIAGLAVDWKEPPKVHGNGITGSTVVTNATAHDFDLTVVIVAVNQIGRATTLGYQHFKLPAGSASEVIPFGSSPGLGTYYVRVDAAAHQSGHKYIYRASKQTTDPLKLSQF